MERTRAWLKQNPDTAVIFDTAERFVQTGDGGFRKDLFGFADLVAIQPTLVGVWAIQVCQGSDFSEHIRKITTDPKVRPNAMWWLIAQNRLSVLAWRKLAKKGPDGRYWQMKEHQFGIMEFGDDKAALRDELEAMRKR